MYWNPNTTTIYSQDKVTYLPHTNFWIHIQAKLNFMEYSKMNHSYFSIHNISKCNLNRIVIKELSFWTALTWTIGMETAFQTKIKENTYIKKYSTRLQVTHKIGFLVLLQCKYLFSYNAMKVQNHHYKKPIIFAKYIFGLKRCLHPQVHC